MTDLPEHIWAFIACVVLTVIFGVVGQLEYQDELYLESRHSDGTAPHPQVGGADSALRSN
jgi:hypothetical protein